MQQIPRNKIFRNPFVEIYLNKENSNYQNLLNPFHFISINKLYFPNLLHSLNIFYKVTSKLKIKTITNAYKLMWANWLDH